MFDVEDTPRIYGIGLGQDFSRVLFEGLASKFAGMSPLDIAQVEVFVNTRRMQRRLTALFHDSNATLLPRIRLVTDIAVDLVGHSLPPAVSSLHRRLEVMQLVKGLIEADPTLASKDAAFDLADSLVALMNEMQGEGVTPEVIHALDVTDQSGHWQRALSFVQLVHHFFSDEALDAEGRQRAVVEHLTTQWTENPPVHPIIVAGSTGSRGATSLFMQAVSALPQGAVVLPGFDSAMPSDVWDKLQPERGGEDHPQYRFKAFCDALGVAPADIRPWTDGALTKSVRSELISLSLRPAPVTDQWIKDGPDLSDITTATAGITLIEAPTPRAEAGAIAARLRQAAEDGQTAALITPDRMLTRQVTAALDRWDIRPDDSAGLPLQLTAPGRLLRHVADLFCEPLDAERLLVLLRHPLTHSGSDRGDHVLRTNALELEIRRNGPAYPNAESLKAWATRTEDRDPGRGLWVDWIASGLNDLRQAHQRPLADIIVDHIRIAEHLSRGSQADGSGELWKEAAGREAYRVISELNAHSEAGGEMSAREYRRLIGSILAGGEVRDRDSGHPQILIWGTLEARVQSADLVILAGLNEGTWPDPPAPDPWLNRPMRMQAGLLLPERRIGLSAHDYQQAVCNPDVVLSRSIRSDEAETVPSRWVNRLTNLLGGLVNQDGPEALAKMRHRGTAWVNLAEQIAAPTKSVDPAPRPSPRPPVEARPTQLSVTQIKTLIRDPYAIYARKVLGLQALDPLSQTADAPLRGIIVHSVLERFIREKVDPSSPDAADRLMAMATDVLEEHCPWPAVRTLWHARIATFVPHFLKEEQHRQTIGTNAGLEVRGRLTLPNITFTLTGTADRIDLTEGEEALIYDYKTGKAPSKPQQLHFDKQLLLEAAMVEHGAFDGINAIRTKSAVYIGLGADLKNQEAPLKDSPTDETLRRFEGLITKWMDPAKGYTSRSANETLTFEGPYDHLARYGEWDETNEPMAEDLS